MAISDYLKLIKSESSKFMRVNPHFPNWIRWAQGYGAFTVDASLRDVRKEYIINQKEHHGVVSFVNEYMTLLREAGIELNENELDEEFN